MEKIKVLRIISRLNIGGPAIHTILLTEGLNHHRFTSVLVTGQTASSEGDMLYLAKERGIRTVIIPELMRNIHLLKDLIAFIKIYGLMIRESPCIMHSHTAKAGTLGRLAGVLYNLTRSKRKCRLVHTFHGHVLEGYFGKARTTFFLWIERILGKFTDRIIVVSQKIKEDLLKLGIGNPEKIIVVPLGLELEKFLHISGPNNTDSTLKIGIIGRLVAIKNHRMFLEVAKKLKDEQKIKIKFFIIGDGELKNKLADYARDWGIQNDIIFMGWQNDLEKIYQDLDIVALTSLNEGTPVSLIEAMAASRPVIATDVGGIRDLLGDNDRGILVRSQDTEEFAGKLKELLENKELREELGRKGRDFVKNIFTKERLIKDMELLYNNLFKKGYGLCAC